MRFMNLQQALSQYPIVRRKTWEPDTAIYSREWYFREKNAIIYRRFPGDYGWQWKPTREDVLADDWELDRRISIGERIQEIDYGPPPLWLSILIGMGFVQTLLHLARWYFHK